MTETNIETQEARMSRIQTWFAADADRAEREKELPRATCRACGGVAKAGEGTRSPERPTGLRPLPADPTRFVAPEPSAPAGTDDWRRECATCATATAAEIVGRVIGYEPDDHDAHAVLNRMFERDATGFDTSTFPFASTAGHGRGRPWAHVRRADRDRVRRVLRDVIDERKPGPCVWGACGLCGVRVSLTWHEGPLFLRWPDDTQAPICDTCQRVLDHRPEPATLEALRVVAVEAATGYAAMNYNAPDEFRVYAETKGCDGNGHALGWDYSPALAEFRDEIWSEHPDLAPEHMRDGYQEKFRERATETRRSYDRQQAAAEQARW